MKKEAADAAADAAESESTLKQLQLAERRLSPVEACTVLCSRLGVISVHLHCMATCFLAVGVRQ